MSHPPVSTPRDHSQINFINDRIFNIFKVHREHTSYHDFLIFADSCQFFRTFLEIYLSSLFGAICMRHMIETPKKPPAIRPRRNCSIMLSFLIRFTMKRIKTTKSALLCSADRRYHDVFKGKGQTAAGRAAP